RPAAGAAWGAAFVSSAGAAAELAERGPPHPHRVHHPRPAPGGYRGEPRGLRCGRPARHAVNPGIAPREIAAVKPANLLFILSDEHSRRVLGSYGHGMIRTPNLDRLAASGVRFTSAYCNSPICVPSRAALATGRYVHDIRFWDNGIPYDGSVPSWHRRLRDAGHEVTAIGKLHFRSADDDNGFTEE